MQTVLSTITKHTKRTIALTKLSIFSVGLISASFVQIVAFSGTAHASDVTCSPDSVNLSGQNWLYGSGVNVCSAKTSSTGVCVSVTGAPGDSNCSSGSIYSGTQWQCVEMVNRLYETRGWTKAWWQGNGGGLSGLIYYLPSGWGYAKQSNGSISYVHPGDVITFNYGTDGHAGIINTIDSSGTLHIINQNTTNPSDVNSTATLNSGTSLSSGNAAYTSSWSGYSVQAIVHHPNTTPTAVARDSNDMDAFYNDGQGDVVDRSWNGTSWSVSHTWSDGGGVMSQPAVVSRSSGNLDVFYTTDQNKLVTYHWTSGGGWTGPTALLTSGVAGDPSVIARNSTDMQVFYRDTAGDVKAIHWTGSSVGYSGTWTTNPQNLYSSNATTDPR